MKRAGIKILLFGLLFAPLSLQAIVYIHYQLGELANRADIIFRGVCEERRKETILNPTTHQPLSIVVNVFKVSEGIKGEMENTMEVKQFNFASRREAFHAGVWVYDPTAFEVGKEYVLFLGPPSKKFDGLRWVIGSGGDGMFKISKDAGGNTTVVNSYGNEGLFPNKQQVGVSKSQQVGGTLSPGPVSYEVFKEQVRKTLQKK